MRAFQAKLVRLSMMTASIAAMTAMATPAVAQAAVRQFDIPSQPLSSALLEFSKQSDVMVVISPEAANGKRAPAVRGSLPVNEAIGRLLRGSGLRAVPNPRGGYRIERETASAPRATQSAAASPGIRETRTASSLGDDAAGSLAEEDAGAEIIVTAQKREQRLRDVPISMTAISGAVLDRSTASGTSEILSRVPGVAIGESYLGGGSRITIRGATASGPVAAGASTAAYYVDSVPFGFATSAIVPDVDIYDLDRIEVLRGPQGTLYGANALNGVVRVLTHEPVLTRFEGKARGLLSSTDEGGENYKIDGMLNIPLVADKLAVRMSAGYQRQSGWIDTPTRDNVNDSESLNLRLKLRAQPTDRLTVSASFWRARNDYGAPSLGDDNGNRSAITDESISNDMDAYGLTVGYEADAFTVSSMSSYVDYSNKTDLDLLPLIGVSFLLHNELNAKVASQEIIINSANTEGYRWSVGGIYRHGKSEIIQSSGSFFYKSESAALFADFTKIFNDGKFEASVGARYFHDDISQSEANGYSARVKFNPVTFRGVLRWKPSESMMLYATYSEGFRSGFSQGSSVFLVAPDFPPLRPDTLKNYELGAKASLLDGRLLVDAAAYYIDWQDVQQNLSLVGADGIPFAAIVNGESASGLGAEASVTWLPFRGLSLSGSFSWNDLEYDENVFTAGPAGPVLFFAKGERLNLSPKYTASISADYRWTLSGNLNAVLSGSANWTSRQDNRNVLGQTLILNRGSSISTSRASLGIEQPDLFSVSLFVENLNNERGIVAPANLPVPEWAGRLRPRTVGVLFEAKF